MSCEEKESEKLLCENGIGNDVGGDRNKDDVTLSDLVFESQKRNCLINDITPESEHPTELIDPDIEVVLPTSAISKKFTSRRSSFSWFNLLQIEREETNCKSSDSVFNELPTPPAPDGGWGWFVVLGAFIVNMIADGLSFSFGVLYPELLVQFETTRGMTSLLGSIFLGTSLMLGPIASSLITRFGCRAVIILGGLLASSGLFLSSFATSIEMLCVTFGFVVGVGFSMLFVANVVIVAVYFKKRRAFATGIAFCGTGFGTFVFAPVLEFLISEYGWRGMFLILSGLSLNLVVCGMLFRPLEFTNSERRQSMLERFKHISSIQEEDRAQTHRSLRFDSQSSEYHVKDDNKALSTFNLPTFIAQSELLVSSVAKFQTLKTSQKQNNILQSVKVNSPSKIDDISGACTKNGFQTHAQLREENNNDLHHVVNESNKENESSEMTISSLYGDSSKEVSSYYLHKRSILGADRDFNLQNFDICLEDNTYQSERRIPDMFSGRRLVGIDFPLSRRDLSQQDKSIITKRQRTLSNSCPEFFKVVTDNSKKLSFFDKFHLVYIETTGVFKRMNIYIKIMKNSFFLVFILSNFIFYLWSDIPYMYSADHAMDNGISSRKASFLLSITGITNTLGQAVFGYIGDLNCNILNIYAIVSMLAGVSIIFIPLMPNYWTACMMYGSFGFLVSVSYPLTIVLLVKYLGLQNLTNGQGLLLMVQGVANLLGPPITGSISDMTGNYDLSYYLSGLFHIVSGLILFCVYIPTLGVKEDDEERSENVQMT